MRWGYGWELGPFELADAIGLRDAGRCLSRRARCRRWSPIGSPPAPTRSAAGAAARRRPACCARRRQGADADRRRATPAPAWSTSATASSAVELHSKMNALGGDAIAMLHKGVAIAEAQFAALVVSTDAVNFSAGANLMLLLIEAQEGNWDEIDLMVRSFQRATMALRLSKVPVVVAPAGLALGGGCEIALHGDRVQAAAETYLGLVEAGVGLIPAGGGTKEMLAARHRPPDARPEHRPRRPDPRACSRRSASRRRRRRRPRRGRSACCAPVDRVSMNRDRVLADAKALALARAAEGYEAPALRDRDPGRRRAGRGDPQARRPPRPPRRAAQRSRRADRPQARPRPRRRRAGRSGTGRRAVPARSGARGVPVAVRRAEDAGAHQAHAGHRQAAPQLMAQSMETAACEIRGDGPPLVLVPGHAGTLGVDDAHRGGAGAPLPRRHLLAVRRTGRPAPRGLLRGRSRPASTTSAARSGRSRSCSSASRSAAASRCTTPPGIPSGSGPWCWPRRRAPASRCRPDRRAGWPGRGCRCRPSC